MRDAVGGPEWPTVPANGLPPARGFARSSAALAVPLMFPTESSLGGNLASPSPQNLDKALNVQKVFGIS